LLSVESGHSVLLSTPGLSRVAVGDGKIAGIVPVGRAGIVVNGKAAGRTTLLVWSDGGLRTYDVTVTEQSLSSLCQMLQGAIANSDVRVDAFGSVAGVIGPPAGRAVLLDGHLDTIELIGVCFLQALVVALVATSVWRKRRAWRVWTTFRALHQLALLLKWDHLNIP